MTFFIILGAVGAIVGMILKGISQGRELEGR
jgi:hypothetical protein